MKYINYHHDLSPNGVSLGPSQSAESNRPIHSNHYQISHGHFHHLHSHCHRWLSTSSLLGSLISSSLCKTHIQLISCCPVLPLHPFYCPINEGINLTRNLPFQQLVSFSQTSSFHLNLLHLLISADASETSLIYKLFFFHLHYLYQNYSIYN